MSPAFLPAQTLFFTHVRAAGAGAWSVLDIAQDARGFLWTATDQGLFRFDGYRYHRYACPLGNGRKSLDRGIACLLADRQGQLWAGTQTGELLRYDPSGDSLVLMQAFVQAGRQPGAAIRAMIEGPDQAIWLSYDSGLARYQDGQTLMFPAQATPSARAPLAQSLRSLVFLGDALWLGYELGDLSRLDIATGEFTHYPTAAATGGYAISALCVWEGKLWLSAFGGGLWQLEGEKAQPIALPEPIKGINTLRPRQGGGLWLATIDGLVAWNPTTGYYQRYTHQISDPARSLPATPVTSLYEDDRRQLWVGAGREGLAVSRLDAPVSFLTIYATALSSEWHAANTLLRDREGNLWCGFFSGALARFHPDGSMAWYREARAGEGTVFDLLQDRQGQVWVARYGQGLQRWDFLGERPLALSQAPPAPPGRLPALDVRGLAEDRDGTLWIATHGQGLFQYRDGAFVPVAAAETPTAWLYEVWIDRAGGIWVGSTLGISYRPPDSAHFRLRPVHPLPATQPQVYHLFDDPAGRVYAITHEGLFRFGADDTAELLSERPGLTGGAACQGFSDAQGRLWVATRQVLHVLEEGIFRPVYWLPDGDQFYRGAVTPGPDGTYYLGLKSGIMQLDPEAAARPVSPPRPIFIHLRVDHEAVQPGRGTIDTHISEAERIVLGPENRVFTLEYGVMDYRQGGSYTYAYRLRGFDQDWNRVGTRREATYTGLPPGTYTLDLRLDQAGSPVVSIDLVVEPPFYRTAWAYTLYTLLAGLLVFALWRFQQIRNRLRVEAQMRQEAQRYYDVRSRLFTYVSHELRTPLTLILGALEGLQAAATAWPGPQQQRLGLVQRHAGRLIRLVNQLMDFRRLEEGALHLRPLYMDLAGFVRHAVEPFEALAAERQQRLVLDLPGQPVYVSGDPEKLEQILYNLLSNATKYAPTGDEIQVSLRAPAGEQLHLQIANGGEGLPPASLQKIFTPFFRGEAEPTAPGSGIGLAFTRALVELHGGEIHLGSPEGAGFVVDVYLPAAPPPAAPLPGPAAAGLPLLLVADDSSDIRALIQLELGTVFQVMEASGGQEALDRAREIQPDLVLLDIKMPGGPDGLTVCRTLKQDPATRHIPVVLLSALDSDASKLDGLETGADDFVAKPFSPAVLRALLQSLLHNRDLTRRQVLDRLLMGDAEGPPQTPEEQFLQDVITRIEAQMADPDFGPEALVGAMPFGKSYVYREVKALTGQTPSLLIRSLRLRRAAALLKADPLANVSQVAYQVGFKDPAYFSRCFREMFGVSPKAFVHQSRGEDES